MSKLTPVLLILFMTGCLPNEKVELKKDGVLFKVSVGEYSQEIRPTEYKVKGTLVVLNESQSNIKFSNKDLYLIIEKEGESRTYIDSPASHVIDLSAVDIPSKESREYAVYWVLPPVKSLSTGKIRLEWRH